MSVGTFPDKTFGFEFADCEDMHGPRQLLGRLFHTMADSLGRPGAANTKRHSKRNCPTQLQSQPFTCTPMPPWQCTVGQTILRTFRASAFSILRTPVNSNHHNLTAGYFLFNCPNSCSLNEMGAVERSNRPCTNRLLGRSGVWFDFNCHLSLPRLRAVPVTPPT